MDYILQAYHIDKTGKAVPLAPEGALNKTVQSGFIWVHLDGNKADTETWLTDDEAVDTTAARTLLSDDTRPRTIMHEDNILLNLRGVNLNPGSEPEDMIGIRFFLEPRRVISVERRALKATQDMANRMSKQLVSPRPSGFIASFALCLSDRMAPTLTALNEEVDQLEDLIEKTHDYACRTNIAEIRREATMMRRYLAPQRDALNTLALQNLNWITDDDRLRMRDGADHATRITEELEAIRERCAIVKDQLTDQRAEEMNRNMMILSVVAAVFLPLGLISGMMGINVGGMPWVENSGGFWYVTAIVTVIGMIQLVIFKLMKWI